MIPKILITVSGGNVQHIASNVPAEIILIDYDNITTGDYDNNHISSHEPDLIANEQWFQSEIDKANTEIDRIKRINNRLEEWTPTQVPIYNL